MCVKFFRCLYIVSSAFSSCFIGTKERPVERWGHAARQPLSVQQRYYQRHTYPSLLSTLARKRNKEGTFSYNICPFQVTSEFLCGSDIYQHVSVQVLTIHQQAKEDQIPYIHIRLSNYPWRQHDFNCLCSLCIKFLPRLSQDLLTILHVVWLFK